MLITHSEIEHSKTFTMRIGIAVNIDKATATDCLASPSDKELIARYGKIYGIPAVNTLIHSFVEAGHFVRIFTVAQKEFAIKTPQVEVYAAAAFDAYPVKYLWGVFHNASRLRALMAGKTADLDVLHAHWTYDSAYAASAYAAQLPVFCTVRDIAPYIWGMVSPKEKVTWTFRLCMNNLVLRNKHIHFIANSPYTAEAMKKRYKVEAAVIPNSIKDSFIKQGEHVYPSQFRILCISSGNDKRKNVIALARAFRMFREKHPESSLRLVGFPFADGNEAMEQWRKEGLLEQVELAGAVAHSKLTELLDACSVFVTPSLEETFGNTLLESIVRKVPAIGGERSGAVPYVLHHGKAGYLCDVASPQSICQALEHVYRHPDEARQKAEEACRIILAEYSEEVVYRKHIELYQSYLKQP